MPMLQRLTEGCLRRLYKYEDSGGPRILGAEFSPPEPLTGQAAKLHAGRRP